MTVHLTNLAAGAAVPPPAAYPATYSATLVTLSFLLAAVGSFAALACAARIPATAGLRRAGWEAGTAVALGGGGIWGMHFLGMLAYQISPPVSFDTPITVLSLAISIAVTGVGVHLVGTDPFSGMRLVVGGLFTGVGIAVVHYTGMAAIRTTGRVSYSSGLVTASVAIGVVAALVAFRIAFTVGGTPRVLAASAVMAAAICGMHYTAMAATRIVPTIGNAARPGVDPFVLGYLATFGVLIVLMLIVFAALGGLTEDDFRVRDVAAWVASASPTIWPEEGAAPDDWPAPVPATAAAAFIPVAESETVELDTAITREAPIPVELLTTGMVDPPALRERSLSVLDPTRVVRANRRRATRARTGRSRSWGSLSPRAAAERAFAMSPPVAPAERAALLPARHRRARS